MELLDYYDERNRVVNSPLIVQYTSEKVYGIWSKTDALGLNILETWRYVWRYRRIASGSYSYVGLDRETA